MSARGYAVYLRILALLPATSFAVAEAIGCHPTQASCYLRNMNRAGLATPVGFDRPVKKGVRIIYGPGNGVRAGRPPIEASNLALFIAALKRGGTIPQLCASTGVHRRQAQQIVALMREAGQLHIADWCTETRTPTAVYQYGSGQDAKRPSRLSRKVVNARYWAARRDKLRQAEVMRALAGVAANDRRAEVAA